MGWITGMRSSSWSPQQPDVNSGSRADIQFRLPMSVLISPLCAIKRNGWARRQVASVFVAKR